MRGTITEKPGRGWYAVLSLSDPKTGKRRRPWHGPYRTRKEAEATLARLVTEYNGGTYVVDPEKLTVRAFFEDRWLPAVRGELRETTAAHYRTVVSLYVVPNLGAERLTRLRPEQLKALYADLEEHGGRDRRPLARQTVGGVHRLIRRALDDAVSWGLLGRNPAALVRPPRPMRREMATYSPEEMACLLGAARDHRLSALFVLACTTGMRRGELVGLPWRAVDLEAGRLTVVQSAVAIGSRLVFNAPKTAAGLRTVPLAPESVAALRKHRAGQQKERFQWGPAWRDHGLVFAREDGSPLVPSALDDTFRRIARRAGLPRIRFHDLRHSWATAALRGNVHPKVVSELLGHASIGITLDTYSHAVPVLSEAATARVADLIFGAG